MNKQVSFWKNEKKLLWNGFEGFENLKWLLKADGILLFQ